MPEVYPYGKYAISVVDACSSLSGIPSYWGNTPSSLEGIHKVSATSAHFAFLPYPSFSEYSFAVYRSFFDMMLV